MLCSRSLLWKSVPFGHCHPVPLPPPLASGNHTPDLFCYELLVCLSLKYNWPTAPREFLLHNIVIQYFYTFETDRHEQSSHHLSLYKDITQLLTPFPTLHTSPRASFILRSPLLPLSSVSCLYTDQNLFVPCLKLCFYFAVFIRFTYTVKSYGICLSLSDLFFWA